MYATSKAPCTMNSEYKPKYYTCPFCNSDRIFLAEESLPKSRGDGKVTVFSVVCGFCGASGPNRKSKSTATAAWNVLFDKRDYADPRMAEYDVG